MNVGHRGATVNSHQESACEFQGMRQGKHRKELVALRYRQVVVDPQQVGDEITVGVQGALGINGSTVCENNRGQVVRFHLDLFLESGFLAGWLGAARILL